MLVVVVLDQLDLADPLQRAVAEHLGQHADLETPVARDAVDAHQIGGHRALARERVAERVEVLEQRQRPEHGLHGAQQRRHEQPRDAAVEAIRDATVVALRELVVQVRVHGREAEPGQQLARVVADVAVVHRDDVRLGGGEHVAVGQPGRAALAALARDREPSARSRSRIARSRGPSLQIRTWRRARRGCGTPSKAARISSKSSRRSAPSTQTTTWCR